MKGKPELNFDKLRKSLRNIMKVDRLEEKFAKFVRIMTYKFFGDEIRELGEKKRNALLRIYEQLRLSDIEQELSYLEAEMESLKAR